MARQIGDVVRIKDKDGIWEDVRGSRGRIVEVNDTNVSITAYGVRVDDDFYVVTVFEDELEEDLW